MFSKISLPKNVIKEFYEKADLQLPQDFKFRQFKIRCGDRWGNIEVNSVEGLRKAALKFLPDDMYVSKACFLEPERLSTKSRRNWNKEEGHYGWNMEWQVSRNLFLWSDLVIETDNNTIENLNKIIEFLERRELDYEPIVKTFRGFHIWSYRFKEIYCDKKIPNPKIREDFFKRQIRKIAFEMRKERIDIDFLTVWAQRQIVRVPGSLHNSGIVCSVVNVESSVVNVESLLNPSHRAAEHIGDEQLLVLSKEGRFEKNKTPLVNGIQTVNKLQRPTIFSGE